MDRMHALNAVEADLAPPAELILRYRKLRIASTLGGSRAIRSAPG